MTAYQSSNQQSDNFTDAKVEDEFEIMMKCQRSWISEHYYCYEHLPRLNFHKTFKNLIRLGCKNFVCSIHNE